MSLRVCLCVCWLDKVFSVEGVSELTLACQTDINSVTEGPLRRFIWLPRRVDSHPGHAGSSSGHENPLVEVYSEIPATDLHGRTRRQTRRRPTLGQTAKSGMGRQLSLFLYQSPTDLISVPCHPHLSGCRALRHLWGHPPTHSS